MGTYSRVVAYQIITIIAVCLNGCAMMFARSELPDMSKIGIHSPRAAVEEQLGSPISDIRTSMGRSGSRKCVYKVLVKHERAPDDSTMDSVVDSFVGFKTYEYRVIYDRDGRVVDVTRVSL